jgi:hypothetical protein
VSNFSFHWRNLELVVAVGDEVLVVGGQDDLLVLLVRELELELEPIL